MLQAIGSLAAHDDRAWTVMWSPDGRRLASCSSDKTVLVMSSELTSKEIEERLNDNSGTVNLFSDVYNNQIRLKHGHTRTIRSVTFSPCGRYMITSSFDSTAIVWQFVNDDWEMYTTLEGHENEVKMATWSRSGQFVATCSRDKSVWVWEVDEDEDLQCCSILQTHSQDVKFVMFHPSIDVGLKHIP